MTRYGKCSQVCPSITSYGHVWQSMADMVKYDTMWQEWTNIAQIWPSIINYD